MTDEKWDSAEHHSHEFNKEAVPSMDAILVNSFTLRLQIDWILKRPGSVLAV